MDQHLNDFAKHLIEREGGSISVATLTAVFTNLGHMVEGKNPAEQRMAVESALSTADGFDVTDGIITLKPADSNVPQEVAIPEPEQPAKQSEQS